MNGVRRFLGAATGAPPEKDLVIPQPNPATSNPTTPLSFVKNTQAPNWPPLSPPAIVPHKQPSLTESIQSTAAFLLGKKDKGLPASAEGDVAVGSPSSVTSPLNGLVAHSKSASREQILGNPSSKGHSTPRNGSTSDCVSPVLPNRGTTHESVNKNTEGGRTSSFGSTRDELLSSLLASEAVVDSREFATLTSEEVGELKKEQDILNTRLGALKKKLDLETKIRDAAISFSKVNTSAKTLSKQTEEQLESANKRVDAAQKELWTISERANDVHRRLMEHRAGVLSFALRNIEKKMAGPAMSYDSGYDSNRSTLMSPTSTSITGTSTRSSKSKFDGAHFFAGHSDAITPKKRLSPEAAAIEIVSLETKLKTATESLSIASKQRADFTRELSLVRLEKQEVETMASFELQTAQETISALEEDRLRLDGLNAQVQGLLQEKKEWEQERLKLEEQNNQVETLQMRIVDLEKRSDEAIIVERSLTEEREESQRHLEDKELEIREMRRQWELEREGWMRERAERERTGEDDVQKLREEMERNRDQGEHALQRTNQELDDGWAALQRMIKEHGIVLFSRESSLKGLLEAVSSHLQTVHSKIEGYKHAEADWSATLRKLEDDVRSGLDKRESLTKELEEARRERDHTKAEMRDLQARRDSSRSSPAIPVNPVFPEVNISPDADVNKLINILLPIWTILPSPEARVAKFGINSPWTYRTGPPLHAHGTQPSVGSLSELDVRVLKTLYSGNRDGALGSPGTPTSTSNVFTMERFAGRVQALIADDKALIERLIRFAQAHDLLKENAERAQRLAQGGTSALGIYQKQVRLLEGRIQEMKSAVPEELQVLRETKERLAAEKHEIESLATGQAETCRQLETRIRELEKALESAEAEVEEMKTSEQTQRAALFEEMNTMNEENTNLRAQLRAARK